MVNVKKNQIVHFRPMCIQPAAYHFKIGDHTNLLTDRYKYCGLIFTEFLDYNVTAKMVARSGSALVLLIAKYQRNQIEECLMISYECFTKLYDSLIQPILDYGASIWGTNEFSCVNAVHIYIHTFFLDFRKFSTSPKCGKTCLSKKQPTFLAILFP